MWQCFMLVRTYDPLEVLLRSMLRFLLGCLWVCALSARAQVCDPSGNLFIFSNYDGGILTINVDQDIPGLVIAISTYEPIDVTITGPFAGNVTEVIYAGMNSSQNNNNCGQGNFTTSINGVDPGIVSITPPMQPPQVGYTPAHNNGTGPWGGVVIGAAGGCDTTVSTGGVNTPDELVYYFEDQTGASLYAHFTQYGCWQSETLNISDGGTCCIDATPPPPPSGCDPDGNVMIFSNYNGGVLNINVDQDIPDLKIGICTYEAVEVNFSGPFVGNIIAVIYAGFDGSNNNCGNGPATTVINGVAPGLVTQYSQTLGNIAIANFLGEPLAPGQPALVNCITGAEGECSTSNSGGGNSAPQIAQFFLAEFGPGSLLFGHFVQYDCFTGTYALSDGGNCCLTETGTPPNPIYVGPATYDFIPYSDTLLCGGSITIDLSAYEVLYQPPTYPGYVWSDGTTGPIITITEPGTYSFYVGDYCHYEEGNWLTDTVVVLPCCAIGGVVSDVIQPGCAGSDGAITVDPLANGVFDFSWDTTPEQNTASITGLGSGGYTVTISNDLGCDTTITFTLTQPTPIEVSISGPDTVCADSEVVLEADVVGGTGDLVYDWSVPGTTDTVTFIALVPQTIDLVVTDAAGCVANASWSLQVLPSPEVFFTLEPDTVCAGDAVQFTAFSVGADSLYWDLGTAGTSSLDAPIADYATAGEETISLVAFSQNGCSSMLVQRTLVVVPQVTLQFSAEPSLCANAIDIAYGAFGAEDVQLLLNDSVVSIATAEVLTLTVPGTGTYALTIQATSAAGCSAEGSVEVQVDEGLGLFVPNVFTPNNDGFNDDFGLSYLDADDRFLLRIFNRWGQEVYTTTDPMLTWDGKDVPDGTYLYLIRATDPCDSDRSVELKGHVTVLR